ncbi:MAG: PA2779 family protein [Elusimicrobia bacterium]|nr:PA2779 family protein [Elusimicrobiota bacterium]
MNARSRKSAVRSLIYTLILTTTALFGDPPSGWANLAPSGIATDAPAPSVSRASDMKTISTALESKALRGRLKAMGLGDKEVESRLGKLSDQEIHQLATQIDAVRPGGLVVEVLVIVVLVLLVIYLFKRV